jgi:hypothetical protein
MATLADLTAHRWRFDSALPAPQDEEGGWLLGVAEQPIPGGAPRRRVRSTVAVLVRHPGPPSGDP